LCSFIPSSRKPREPSIKQSCNISGKKTISASIKSIKKKTQTKHVIKKEKEEKVNV
jgi:hypothetical protein